MSKTNTPYRCSTVQSENNQPTSSHRKRLNSVSTSQIYQYKKLLTQFTCPSALMRCRCGWLLTGCYSTLPRLRCSSARRQRQIPTRSVRIGNTSVVPVYVVRDFWVYIDADLTISAHITATVRACFAALRQIRSVRRSLTRLTTVLPH